MESPVNGKPRDSACHPKMADLLEWLRGRGFMAPGGAENVARMMFGIEGRGRHVLDLGSGLGGPAFMLACNYGARVTGVDLERLLVERARERNAEMGLESRIDFHVLEPGPLTFADGCFDIVFSSGAIHRAPDKAGILGQCFRVLRPGGILTVYDWLRSEGEPSRDMLHFFAPEGLACTLVSLDELAGHAREAGFESVSTDDVSGWYRRECRREYELMRGPGYARVVRLVGCADADHLIEHWRSMVKACDKGELRQGYLRARKPGEGQSPGNEPGR